MIRAMRAGASWLFGAVMLIAACERKEDGAERCAKELYPILRERLALRYSRDEVMQEARRTCDVQQRQASERKAADEALRSEPEAACLERLDRQLGLEKDVMTPAQIAEHQRMAKAECLRNRQGKGW